MKTFTFTMALGLLNGCLAAAIDVNSDVTAISHQAPCVEGTKKIISTTIIDGEPLIHSTCNIAAVSKRTDGTNEIFERQTQESQYVCGSTAHVDVDCRPFYGDLPDPHDCYHIARQVNALGNVTVAYREQPQWTYKTCSVGIQNYRNETLVFCTDKHDLSGVISYLAFECKGSTPDGQITGGQASYRTYSSVFTYFGAPLS